MDNMVKNRTEYDMYIDCIWTDAMKSISSFRFRALGPRESRCWSISRRDREDEEMWVQISGLEETKSDTSEN